MYQKLIDYASSLHNMRKNIYKEKIIKLLEKNHLLSINEIHNHFLNADFSTISRNINKLVIEQKIKKIVLDKDNVKYEINNLKNNHDHVICNKCGKVDEIEISFNKDKVKNFSLIDIIVKGICNKCNKKV